MGFEEKTPDLLALLTAYTGGSTPAVVVVPRPPILALTRASSADAINKKRKRAQGGKDNEGVKEGEVTHSSYQPPAKEAWTARGQKKKKNTSSGTLKELEGDKPPKHFVWRPLFTLSSGNPVLDDANLRDHQKGSSGFMAECLEKALCLLEEMQELRSFRKSEVFLSLKQDLAKVHDYPP